MRGSVRVLSSLSLWRAAPTHLATCLGSHQEWIWGLGKQILQFSTLNSAKDSHMLPEGPELNKYSQCVGI